MENGIRTGNNRGLKKRPVGSWVWQETPQEGLGTFRLKRSEYNNEDEDNSLKTLNDKYHQASLQKFKQLMNISQCGF